MVNATLGTLAGTILFLGYFPQLRTLYNSKRIDGISILFWFFVAISVEITLHNLMLHGAVWYVSIPQLLNALVALIILLWVTTKKKGWEYSLLIFTLYVIMTVGLPLISNDFSQHIATISIIVAYLVQIYYLYKNKTVKGINPLLFIFIGLALLIMTINIYTMTDYPLAASTEITNMILVSIIVAMIYKYKNNA